MKRMTDILLALSFLLPLCSCDDAAPSSQPADWNPSFSRSLGDEVRIVGRKNGAITFDRILIPSSDGGMAVWKDNQRPDAGKVAASNEFIAFMPADNHLPAYIEHDGETPYYMDYQTSKPEFFSMYALMSQIKVHIWVEMEKSGSQDYQVNNDGVLLYTRAEIDYPNRTLENPSQRQRVSWGSFSQSDVTDGNGRHFLKLSNEKPLVVIPQTVTADDELIWFSIGNAHYYFKPGSTIELKAGYLASITLHVTYEEEDEETPSDSPTKKVIAVDKHTITITPWEMGETYNEQVTTPDK